MASRAPVLRQHGAAAPPSPPPRITCVKDLAESPNLISIPSKYAYSTSPIETAVLDDTAYSIPVVDLSLLTSHNIHHKAKAIHDLHNACLQWGFFLVVNHGIPEELMRGMIEATSEFFNLSDDEKPEFQPKDVVNPIRYGTSFNTEKEKTFCWRDFLKVFVHPHFNCPAKPQSLRSITRILERSREVVRKLSRVISVGLGLEEEAAEKALKLESSLQIFIGNLYPRCPNPDIAMGLPPHSDHGLFTLVIENQVAGLQIQHKGRWINVKPLPNSLLVNTGDHLQIFSNGKYKSVMHRAVVNKEKARMSIAMANGPSPDTVVCPAPQLVQREGCVAEYVPVKYEDYILAQQSNRLNGKSILERLQIQH